MLQGGKFGNGFLRAGITAGLGTWGKSSGALKKVMSNDFGNIAVQATIGGTASELTGGKFKNGAAAGAFAAAVSTDWGGSEKGGAPDTEGTAKGYRRINSDVDGDGVVDITFVNDDPNGLTTDLAVREELATMVEDVVRETGLDININSTKRGTGCSSNHCYQNAVDINRVNGMRIDDLAALGNATKLQNAFQGHSRIRENFGPAYNVKTLSSGVKDMSYSSYIVNKHKNHIHVSGAW